MDGMAAHVIQSTLISLSGVTLAWESSSHLDETLLFQLKKLLQDFGVCNISMEDGLFKIGTKSHACQFISFHKCSCGHAYNFGTNCESTHATTQVVNGNSLEVRFLWMLEGFSCFTKCASCQVLIAFDKVNKRVDALGKLGSIKDLEALLRRYASALECATSDTFKFGHNAEAAAGFKAFHWKVHGM
jgi:hypothetical protein